MPRPSRIEFPGAVYHVTSRGDRQEPIYVDERDRVRFLEIVAHAMEQFDAEVLAYCLMGNHYHLVLHTRRANLSRVMRDINGESARTFNRRHAVVGHLFQGRFKAIHVDRDAYLMTLCRYVELNPVRVGMVDQPADWAWSSYRAHAGIDPPPAWLNSAELYAHLLGHPAESPEERRRAAHQYVALVADGAEVDPWRDSLRHDIYLGDDAFIARTRAHAERPPARRNHEAEAR